MPSITHLGVGT